MFDFHAITRQRRSREKKTIKNHTKNALLPTKLLLKPTTKTHNSNSPQEGISNLINDVRQRFITIFLPKINLNASLSFLFHRKAKTLVAKDKRHRLTFLVGAKKRKKMLSTKARGNIFLFRRKMKQYKMSGDEINYIKETKH